MKLDYIYNSIDLGFYFKCENHYYNTFYEDLKKISEFSFGLIYCDNVLRFEVEDKTKYSRAEVAEIFKNRLLAYNLIETAAFAVPIVCIHKMFDLENKILDDRLLKERVGIEDLGLVSKNASHHSAKLDEFYVLFVTNISLDRVIMYKRLIVKNESIIHYTPISASLKKRKSIYYIEQFFDYAVEN